MKTNIELLKEICEISSPSGFEMNLSSFVEVKLKEANFEVEYDKLNGILGLKKSKVENAKKVVIDAHLDEVGFVITKINEQGLLSFEVLGAIDPYALFGKRIILFVNNQPIYGSIASLSPHLLTSAQQKDRFEIEKMLIDIGACNKKEAEELGIRPGIFGVYDTHFVNFNRRIITKAGDDRVGIYLLIELINSLKDIDLPFDLYIVGSVQEEVGLRGSKTMAQKINPDLVITVDVSPANDLENKEDMGNLGEGTILRIIDALYITPKKVLTFQEQLAEKAKIKTQYYISKGATNAVQYNLAHDGALVIQCTLPGRNLHSESVVIDLDDIEATYEMIYQIIINLNEKVFKDLGLISV